MIKITQDKIKNLENEILYHQNLYYNKTPEISDAEFDLLVDELKTVEPNNPVLNLVGKDSNVKFAKVKHVIPMNSQAKANQILEFKKWAKKYSYPQYIVQYKLDGISVELQYVKGKLIRAISRGNGKIGDDITENVKKMKFVPDKIDKNFSGGVRGEILMFHSIFNEKYSDQKNCRNTASGISKRKDGKGCRNLSVFCYNAMNLANPFNNELDKIKWLENNNFKSVITKNFKNIDKIINYREEIFKSTRKNLDYDIDGLVVKDNNIDWNDMKREKPMKQIAFKFPPEEAITKLINVEWSESGGTYTPVAIVNPVELAGTTVQRASLANPNLIEDLGLNIGSQVIIVKRGEIIPKIIRVINSHKIQNP